MRLKTEYNLQQKLTHNSKQPEGTDAVIVVE